MSDQMSEPMYLKMFQTKMNAMMFGAKNSEKVNGQIVRLLYSDKSGILTVHLQNLDPFNITGQK